MILFAVLLALALFGVVFGTMYGLTEYFRPAKNIAATKADVSVDAKDLFSAFEKDEQRADAAYLNKVIAVNGPVAEISKDQSGASVVVLRGADMETGVNCTMTADQSEKAAALKTGQRVTIKGVCTGYTGMEMMPGDVVLTNGSLVE